MQDTQRFNGEEIAEIEINLQPSSHVESVIKRISNSNTNVNIDIPSTKKSDGYPYQDVLIDGKLIKKAKQEIRGHKIVLVDPKGKVVHTMQSNPISSKKRKKKKK